MQGGKLQGSKPGHDVCVSSESVEVEQEPEKMVSEKQETVMHARLVLPPWT